MLISSLKIFIFKNMQSQVSDDFINGEIYEIEQDGEIKYKLKCNTSHQMAAYYGAFMSISYIMLALPLIRVPICHVIGEKQFGILLKVFHGLEMQLNQNSYPKLLMYQMVNIY